MALVRLDFFFIISFIVSQYIALKSFKMCEKYLHALDPGCLRLKMDQNIKNLLRNQLLEKLRKIEKYKNRDT